MTRLDDAKVPVRRYRRHPSARCSLQQPLLNQIGLDDILQRIALLADCGRQVINTDRTAGEFFDDSEQEFSIHDVQAQPIDLQHRERRVGYGLRDLPSSLDLGIVTHAP